MPRIAVVLLVLILSACAGRSGGPDPAFEHPDTHQVPLVGNTGFYDGGVFDPDMDRLTRGRPSLSPSM